ncbi:hypothetical protein ACQP3L_36530, partial [Escherichia coli]
QLPLGHRRLGKKVCSEESCSKSTDQHVYFMSMLGMCDISCQYWELYSIPIFYTDFLKTLVKLMTDIDF